MAELYDKFVEAQKEVDELRAQKNENAKSMKQKLEQEELAAMANVARPCWHAEDVEAMAKAGTFCGALHYRLVKILQGLISKMMAFFDRNHSLQLFGEVSGALLRHGGLRDLLAALQAAP